MSRKTTTTRDGISEPISMRNFNANSILIALATMLILAPLGWIGSKTSQNNDKLIRVETSLPNIQSSQIKLEAQVTALSLAVGQMVTRSELESKINEVRRDFEKSRK